MADNGTTRNRYPKVCAGAETRTALARASNSYHRARSPPAACAPLSVPASAPALQTLPACPDAPHLMRHVLTALRSSLAHRVSRSIKDRPGVGELLQGGAADGYSTSASTNWNVQTLRRQRQINARPRDRWPSGVPRWHDSHSSGSSGQWSASCLRRRGPGRLGSMSVVYGPAMARNRDLGSATAMLYNARM